jgi:hypothetical protein
MAKTETRTKRSAEPQTQPMDPTDPDYTSWIEEQSERETRLAREILSAWLPAGVEAGAEAKRARIPGDGPIERPPRRPSGGGGTGGGGTGGGLRPAPPLTSFFAYVNSRPNVDWNTCGQAAVASMVDFYGKDLGIPKSGAHWPHGAAIDRVKAVGFGPDVIFGWGTTPNRIRDALNHFGVPAQAHSSGLFFSGWPTLWNRLLAYVYYSAIPVPVLVDMGMLGGSAFGAHWPILWKMEYSSTGMRLTLGNWSQSWMSQPIPSERFLEAWACRHLPLGFNHAAIYTGTPKVSF